MWEAEDQHVKQLYKAKAEAEKATHLRRYPNYQYQPRKPAEKKRRMTKKKAAALASSSQGLIGSRLHGKTNSMKSASLPITPQVPVDVAGFNQWIKPAGQTVNPKTSSGFGFAPSAEYVTAQEEDLNVLAEALPSIFGPTQDSLSYALEVAYGISPAGNEFPLDADDLIAMDGYF
jgi:hypothetical protein